MSASKSRLDTIRFSFDQWFEPYRNKLSAVAQSGQEFRTFQLASAGRLQYYLVFRQRMVEPLLRQPRTKCRPLGNTSLLREMALELSSFMVEVFSSHQGLKACGINKQTWSGLGKKSHDLDHKTFLLFQKELFARWNSFATGQYWSTVLPEIHVYSYGANQAISYNDPDSLDAITEDLNRQYDPSNISTLSFAIATQISLTQVESSGSHPHALLASTEQIFNQYNSQKASHSRLRTFPILLSPKACNFQSETLPEFYKDAIRSIIKKVEGDNKEVDSVVPPLDFVSFQGYSFFQKQMHSDFLLGQTNYAGAHCISEDHLQGVNLNKLHKLRESTAVHRPIVIVNEGLTVLGSGDPIPFRFEPVITISLHSLNKDNRTFEYIIYEIIKPLLDLWHNNEIQQILLPFDISVSLLCP